MFTSLGCFPFKSRLLFKGSRQPGRQIEVTKMFPFVETAYERVG